MTHPPDASSSRPGTALPTRDRLVRAAVDLFASRGYHDTKTPDIARRAGVAEGTIYRHFTSKAQLLNELYRAGLRVFLRAFEGFPADATCRDRLERVAASWREIAVRDPALCRLVLERRFAGLLDQRSRQQAATLRGELTKVIATGKAAGTVRAGGAETWAEVWFAVIAMGLERIAEGSWRPDDGRPDLVGAAAWHAISDPGALQGGQTA